LYHLIVKPYRSKAQVHNKFKAAFLVQLLLIILPIVFLIGCSNEEPVRIGFIGGLTGRVADLGISGRNGAILAVEQRNSMGGIQRRPVHLITVDDKQDKNTAARALTSLLDQKVAAIIGHMTSSMSVTTVPLVNNHSIVMVSPTSTTTYLKNIDDYFFRVCATTDKYGAEMARYFRNIKGLDRVTVIFDMGNKAYTENWVNHFSEEFTQLGGVIVQKTTFTSGPETHFTEVVQEALKLETEGLIIASNAADAAMICQQIRKMNISIPIGTSEWAATEKLIELGGISVENIVVSQFFDRYSTNPRYIQFRDEFKKRFGQYPGFASVGAYDATNVVLDALAQKDKNQSLKQVILNIGIFNGIQNKITFNQFGDSDRATYLSVIRNGKFVSTDNSELP
jgi:branched-chain amino acid transport system substrate-binding protein